MPPNLVIFNPDQWRGDVLGHLGHPAAVTPNLDALVQTDAISIRHAFCQNPVCTPSRCSFMTGWYPHTRGHRTMRHMLHPERGEPVLLKILKDAGYFVWWGGKNDLVPGRDGPGTYCDVKFSATTEDVKRWGIKPVPRDQSWRGAPGDDSYYGFLQGCMDTGDEIAGDGDWQNLLGAIDFIQNYDGEKPFCIYLPLGFPHPAYRVEQRYYDLIDPDSLPLPAPMPSEETFEPRMRRGIRERMGIADWPQERWREVQRTYYAMCARVDDQFGRLLTALEDANHYDDTAVFFFSDHGDYTGDYRMVEKAQNTFEDCLTRVPLIIKPPARIPTTPGVRDCLGELVDFPATVYDLCGLDPCYSHFGRSLVPLIETAQPWRDAVFCEGGRLLGEEQCTEGANNPDLDPSSMYWPRQYAQMDLHAIDHGKAAMCRTAKYKYIKRLYEPDQLFDLAADPKETRDIAKDPAYAQILRLLERRMLDWYMATCDTVPHDIDARGF